MKRLCATLTIAALAALATGCGDDEDGGSARSPQQTAASSSSEVADRSPDSKAARKATEAEMGVAAASSQSRPGRKVTVVDSDYGPVVADARGEAFYLFAKERRKRSECYGACAVAWPPVLTKGRPRAGQGIDAKLLGTTRRRNGKLQVTYRGHPLYYYVDDAPGTILCQDVSEFGGRWLVVKPSGNPVT